MGLMSERVLPPSSVDHITSERKKEEDEKCFDNIRYLTYALHIFAFCNILHTAYRMFFQQFFVSEIFFFIGLTISSIVQMKMDRAWYLPLIISTNYIFRSIFF